MVRVILSEGFTSERLTARDENALECGREAAAVEFERTAVADATALQVAPTFRACPERSEGSAGADLEVSATHKRKFRAQHQ